MDVAVTAVVVGGLIIGTIIGLFAQPTSRVGQVFLWTISGSIAGGYAGALGGFILVAMLLPPGGEAFAGLGVALNASAICGLLGAVFGGLLALTLLERNSTQTRNLLSFLIAIFLVATVVVQVTHLYQN